MFYQSVNLNKKVSFLLTLIFISFSNLIYSQEEKDNSKPTNIYSQIDHFVEFNHSPEGDTYSYNPRVSYTFDETNLLLVELPYRFLPKTNASGLGDPRLRYFYIPFKDYTKTISSVGLSLDVTLPLGDTKKGIGDGCFKFAPGLMLGFMANKSQTISFFPTIAYQYTYQQKQSEQSKDQIYHGLNIEFLSSFVLSEDLFVHVKPILDVKDMSNFSQSEFVLEVEPVVDICKDKYQVGVFYKGEFRKNAHTFSVYFTIFI
ncbi:hypothetical protein [Flammeovirga sp. EKP202]|uniref:hypothetical protein n=1 Tax=Flammeovirga sp. EKP202 TaxID=2770592 RepID=UPI00165FE2C7|nr:hypothetical protein [Flammeovirga sp. EKP202]MBD0400110.1 hypothetical protein [Flammeovirga sp. EKP202]